MVNKKFELDILNLLKQGLNPSKISKQLNIKLSLLSYYITKFKKLGIIKKVSYGTYEVQNITSNTLTKKVKQIRGHAFIWTVKLNKKFNWLELLKNQEFKLVRNKTPRIVVSNHKVWLGLKTITVYENKSFYANNSINSRKYAVISLIEVLDAIQSKLKINIRPYIFKPTREHYGMIKNDLARQYNRNNEKMIIKDDLEGEWLWIDDSESLGELETKNIVRSKQVQDWWNDNKRHDFKVTPSFLMESLSKLTNVQIESNRQLLLYQEQNKEHLKLIKLYQKEAELRIKEIKKKKVSLKEFQTSLGDY